MDGIDLARKTERLHSADKGVGQGDAALRGRTEHAYGFWLEQRTEALQRRQRVARLGRGAASGGVGFARTTRASTATSPCSPTTIGLMSNSAMSARSRISRPSRPPTFRTRHQCAPVDRASSACPVEQDCAFEFAEHAVGVVSVDRADAERDVLEDLDEDAAETDHHHRPELRIAVAADHDLLAPRRHFLDEPALRPGRLDRGNFGHRDHGVADCHKSFRWSRTPPTSLLWSSLAEMTFTTSGGVRPCAFAAASSASLARTRRGTGIDTLWREQNVSSKACRSRCRASFSPETPMMPRRRRRASRLRWW